MSKILENMKKGLPVAQPVNFWIEIELEKLQVLKQLNKKKVG